MFNLTLFKMVHLSTTVLLPIPRTKLKKKKFFVIFYAILHVIKFIYQNIHIF